MTFKKFSTRRIFSESLFRVIDSPIQTKKKWSQLLSGIDADGMKLKPVFIIGDVLVMDDQDKKRVIMNATQIDLLIDAVRNQNHIAPIIADSIHENQQCIIMVIASWHRADEKQRLNIEKQFARFFATWTDKEKKEAKRWATKQKGKADAILSILRS